ncbi:hypothetical protein ACOMHN_013127 [Nucella lapillus]
MSSERHTLVDSLRQLVQDQGDSPAFIFRSPHHGRYELSWAKLYKLAGTFAAELNSRGLGRGQLVVSTLVNSPERVVCEAGLWMSGAASVNGHCQMADGSDLINTIRVSRAAALLVDPDINNSPWDLLKGHVSLGEGDDDDATSSLMPDLKRVFFIRRAEKGDPEDFITRLETGNQWFEADDITSEDTLTVFTTSGTTGFSKLVVYSHHDYMLPQEAQSTADVFGNTYRGVRMFKTAPLGWLGGYTGFGIVNCHTTVLCDARAREIKDMAKLIFESIEEEKCVSALIAPMYLPRLVQLLKTKQENCDPKSEAKEAAGFQLENILLGGLPISKTMIECALCLAPVVVSGYGATDFHFVSGIMVTDSDSFVDYDTGMPTKSVSVKIVSPENEDKVLPVNQTGNILVKAGSARRQGYMNDPALTTEDCVTTDGFFRTRDVGRLDERGHLIVEGRGCDAIMRGPYIFYPAWIEARIRAHPGVRGVIITGIPDPFLHEELCACIVLGSDSVTTLDEVRHFVEKDIVTSEDDPLSPRPRYYLEFESFPVTDTGKLKRQVVKALAAERLRRCE